MNNHEVDNKLRTLVEAKKKLETQDITLKEQLRQTDIKLDSEIKALSEFSIDVTAMSDAEVDGLIADKSLELENLMKEIEDELTENSGDNKEN
jgi:hypothetical protein